MWSIYTAKIVKLGQEHWCDGYSSWGGAGIAFGMNFSLFDLGFTSAFNFGQSLPMSTKAKSITPKLRSNHVSGECICVSPQENFKKYPVVLSFWMYMPVKLLHTLRPQHLLQTDDNRQGVYVLSTTTWLKKKSE